MEIDDRVKYYMGKWHDTKYVILNPERYQCDTKLPHDKLLLATRNHLSRIRSGTYTKLLEQAMKSMADDVQFLLSWGDTTYGRDDIPVIAKTRFAGTRGSIILNLNHERHWGNVRRVAGNDMEYARKKEGIVWRGTTTGPGSELSNMRFQFVSKFHAAFDVGFDQVVQGRDAWSMYVKSYLSLKDQLAYKFLVSIEGNDVASGLKWQLYSNSVVMMAKPTKTSWAMEDTLIPYVHYIPLADDYSDLLEKYEWALAHEGKCMEISGNARAFVQLFLDRDREREIHKRIMMRYVENIQIGDTSDTTC